MLWKNSRVKETLLNFMEKNFSLFQSFSSKIYATLQAWFPESTAGIKRLQFLRLSCIVLGILALSYGLVLFLFEKTPQGTSEPPKPKPLTIATATQKIDLNEARWHTLDDENKKLCQEIASLKKDVSDFLNGQKEIIGDALEQPILNNDELELQNNLSAIENQNLPQETSLDAIQAPSQNINSSYQGPQAYQTPLNEAQEQERPLIQKFSLNLSNHLKNKHLKTAETTIPAGSFAKAILLSGLDASSAMNASSDPRPMLLRVVHPGTLPRRFQSDLKDCHCTASAFGDLSSERIFARLEKLTCIERSTGGIIEIQVAGYIAGADGKAGIRGIVASKDGQFLARSLMGGFFAGLSNVSNPQNRQTQVNPFYPGSSQATPPGIGSMFASGMAGGATTALDRLSQYYIDRAEQLQPVIQVAAGQAVDIVFTEGTAIIDGSVSDIRNQNHRIQESSIAEDR